MYLDVKNMFSDAQDLAKTNATYLSDKSIDMRATGTVPLGGSPLADAGLSDAEIIAQVTEAFTTAAGGTLQVNVVVADDAALTSNLVILASTPVLAAAGLVAGYQFRVATDIPPMGTKRYLGLQYVIGTGAMSTGKITAGVVLSRQSTFVG